MRVGQDRTESSCRFPPIVAPIDAISEHIHLDRGRLVGGSVRWRNPEIGAEGRGYSDSSVLGSVREGDLLCGQEMLSENLAAAWRGCAE